MPDIPHPASILNMIVFIYGFPHGSIKLLCFRMLFLQKFIPFLSFCAFGNLDGERRAKNPRKLFTGILVLDFRFAPGVKTLVSSGCFDMCG